jgi:hypothetical protein
LWTADTPRPRLGACLVGEKNLGSATVAFFVLFGNLCPIIDLLGSKDLSRDLQLNCIISFFFRLHLVLNVYAARFNVTGTVALFGFPFWN